MDFHKSISNELLLTQNRVRNLIGDKHWASDGAYKEVIFKQVINRFLPKNIETGSGFIVDTINGEIHCSTQIDVILYDTNYPVMFRQNDFVIISPQSVKGIIEIKTNPNQKTIRKAITQLTKICDVLIPQNIFVGIFAFNYQYNYIHLKSALLENKGKVNHLALGNKFFIKYWPEIWNQNVKNSPSKFSIYKLEDLCISYFISNLIADITDHDLTGNNWFMFPLPEGKEEHLKEEFFLES